MVFTACGLNHKTAPLAVRERVALSSGMHDRILNHLVNTPFTAEAALLSTCNRTEIYCDIENPAALPAWIAHQYQLSPDMLTPYLYTYQENQAVHHALRVASGLDSMLIGEPQILGQMKQAYQQAFQLGTVKQTLQTVFQYVFNATKRIRTHSGISKNPISVAYAAVQLIGQVFNDYSTCQIFIIGSGETASLVAKYLQKKGAKHFIIASRNQENAHLLAQSFTGKAISITDIPFYLPKADIIISATTCPFPFINKNLVSHALQQRSMQPMFFLDLAVPRDIEADVGELTGVHLYNIDDLQNVVGKGFKERQVAAQQAEEMVNEALENYIRRHHFLKSKHIICEYREQMQQLAEQELQRATQKLETGMCQFTVLKEFSERLVNKLTHIPTIGLRQMASDNQVELLNLAQSLLQKSTHEKIS